MTDGVEPEVEAYGPGEEPAVTVVGGVHGDEPSGIRAIERVLASEPEFRRRVQFVRANPPALDAGRRYLDTDLNRAFPGDRDGDAREERLAAALLDVVGDTPTLSLHSTHSQPEPMALVSRGQPAAVDVAADLPAPYVVETGAAGGTLTAHGTVVTVEAGCQHSEAAADTATEFVRAFLRLFDVLPGDPPAADPDFYAMDEPVGKPPDAPDGAACRDVFDLRAANFEPVASGETWATVDGEPLVADEPFVPILMSECGYRDIFGYRGHFVGDSVGDARRAWTG